MFYEPIDSVFGTVIACVFVLTVGLSIYYIIVRYCQAPLR